MIAATTNLDKCYQLLGICRGASLNELKTAYRALARKWHPDLNPGNERAHQQFIALNHAYEILLDKILSHATRATPVEPTETQAVKVARSAPQPASPPPQSSPKESELKWQLYYEIQSLLKQQQFLKAIVLIEGLVRHAPHDRQVCQWQGIIYSQFGYQLIDRRDFQKARIYLKKALKADPYNRQLWQEVDRAFSRIERLS